MNEQHVILAAEITIDAPDFGHLEPMLDTALAQLERHGVSEAPEVVLADAGYWHTGQIQSIAERGMEVLVPPDGTMRDRIRPGWEHGFFDAMRQKLLTDHSRQLYAKRKITVDPVYRQIKRNRHMKRFMRKGRAPAQSEWRLIAATHNLRAQAPQPLDRELRLTKGGSLFDRRAGLLSTGARSTRASWAYSDSLATYQSSEKAGRPRAAPGTALSGGS